MDKDAFYFPHFSNARLDRKIKRVRKELGLEGYGIYFMILETLRDQENFNYPLKDIDLLADEFGTSEQKIRTVISNYDLFRITDDEHFFSPKLLVFLQPYLEGKEKRRIGGIKGNLIRYKHITKDEAKDLNDAQILDIHNSITFKSAFNSLPIAKDSLTEQATDRFGSQIQYNSTQLNEIQDNEIQQNTYKEKNTKKENSNFDRPVYENYPSNVSSEPVVKDEPTKLSKLITQGINHWNSKPNLPACRYTVITLPNNKLADITNMFDVHRNGEILTAIDNLSKAYDTEDPKYRTKSFQNFITTSLDNWFEERSTEPVKRNYRTEQERRFFDHVLKMSTSTPEWIEEMKGKCIDSLIAIGEEFIDYENN